MYNLFIYIYLFFTHTLSPMVQMTHTFVNFFCKNKKLFTFTKFQITFVKKEMVFTIDKSKTKLW